MNPDIQKIPETSFGFRTRLYFVLDCLRAHGVALSPSTRVLDVGCGAGDLVTTPLASLGPTVLGIDMHAASIEHARATGSPARFEVATLDEVRAKEKPFDVTICSEVLEHLHEPRAMLRQLAAVTAEDGLLIVTVPNGYGAYEMSMRFSNVYQASPRLGRGWRGVKSMIGLRGPDRADRAEQSENAPDAKPAPCGGTLNQDSGHVQFFTWWRLRRIFAESGWKVAGHRGRTLLCGPILSRWIDRDATRVARNARLAGVLPTWLAADWMFCLVRDRGARA